MMKVDWECFNQLTPHFACQRNCLVILAMVINLENVILKINFMYFIFNTRKGNTIVIIKQFKILFAYHIYDIHCTLI
jgi:hypothetical protein